MSCRAYQQVSLPLSVLVAAGVVGMCRPAIGPATTVQAAVAVVVNNCDREAVLATEPIWGASTTRRVPPRRAVAIFVPHAIQARVAVDSVSTVTALRPWEIHRLDWNGRELHVEVAALGHVRPPLWLTPAVLAAPPSRVILRVAVFVDDAQPAQPSAWEPRVRAQLAAVSEALTRSCGVSLQVVSVGSWRSSNDESMSREAREAEFRNKTSAEAAQVILGFSSRLRIPYSAAMHHPPREPLASHILVPDVHQEMTAQEQWWLLLHEFAHWLGAFDLSEGESVMNPELKPAEYAAKAAVEPWDAINLLIVNLTADELRYRGAGDFDAFSSGTRDFLLSLYQRAGTGGKPNADALRLAKSWMRPPLPAGRFLAAFADGSMVAGDAVTGWGPAGGSPEIGGRPLFDANNPASWVRRSQPAIADGAGSGVEFFGGDRIAGRVIGIRPAEVAESRYLPLRLEVQPGVGLTSPFDASAAAIDVATHWLRRVILRPLGVPYRPGTVFLADGRPIPFRSIQWNAEGVRILTDDGVQQLDLPSLAEVHLPQADVWEVLLQEWATLSPSGDDLLIEYTLSDGSRVTTSRRFLAAFPEGDQPPQGYHAILPAWSPHLIWVPYQALQGWRIFAPHRVPLTLLPAAEYEEHPALGGYWGPGIDRNLAGEPLAVGNRPFGWGLSLTAPASIAFSLPPSPASFESWIGLDRLAGDGGCARAGVIYASASQQPLFQSKLLIGSQTSATGRLALPGDPQARLVLFTEDAEQDRPPAADPWNIRDCVDWGEPLLHLDRQWLKRELQRRWPLAVPAWTGWQVDPAPAEGGWALETYAVVEEPRRLRLGWVTALANRPLVLSRRFFVPADAAELVVRARVTPTSAPVRIRLEADGNVLGEAQLRGRGTGERPETVAADVASLRGRTVALRITAEAASPQTRVEWHAIAITAEAAGGQAGHETDKSQSQP